jgi:hypothetical protein
MGLPPALVAGRPVRLRHQRRRTPCRRIDSQAWIFFKILSGAAAAVRAGVRFAC